MNSRHKAAQIRLDPELETQIRKSLRKLVDEHGLTWCANYLVSQALGNNNIPLTPQHRREIGGQVRGSQLAAAAKAALK